MTIYEIRDRTLQTSPYFFVSKTLKFFGQTMSSFTVSKQEDGKYLIEAPMYDNTRGGKKMGTTRRLFNPETCELENVK